MKSYSDETINKAYQTICKRLKRYSKLRNKKIYNPIPALTYLDSTTAKLDLQFGNVHYVSGLAAHANYRNPLVIKVTPSIAKPCARCVIYSLYSMRNHGMPCEEFKRLWVESIVGHSAYVIDWEKFIDASESIESLAIEYDMNK